jgi:5-formyltetrahydrofolate cyclo-ligase
MSAARPLGALAARKRALRSRARGEALSVPQAERARRSRGIQERLLGLAELAEARSWALYAPLADEVQLDLLPLRLRARGSRLAYPRIDGDGLAFHWVEAESALALRAGLPALEPASETPLAPPEELDAIVIPGLLFDRRGHRLGRGGGHYDRFLARLPAAVATLGLCLADQLVQELPAEPHDLPLRWVVTDQEVLRIS